MKTATLGLRDALRYGWRFKIVAELDGRPVLIAERPGASRVTLRVEQPVSESILEALDALLAQLERSA